MVVDLDEPTCSSAEGLNGENEQKRKRRRNRNPAINRVLKKSRKQLEEEVTSLTKQVENRDFANVKLKEKQKKLMRKHKDKTTYYRKSKNKRLKNLKSKMEKNKEESAFYKDFQKLNESLLRFFKMQVNHVKRRKWTEEERQFAVCLFYKSRKAYGYLRDKQLFALPCVSKTRRWVNELDLAQGKTGNLLELLKHKTARMSPKERECVVMWDEMSIKECLEWNTKKDYVEGFADLGEHGRSSKIGNHVLVFMIRGRQTNWRQTLCYYVAHNSVGGDDLKTIILDVLDFAEEAGFKVKSMVCDLGGPNQRAVKQLGITTDKPWIERYDRKIFFNYDPPHLLKCLRNNFRSRNLKVGDQNVSW